jgi:S-adenosylmethionine hydrolase
MHYRTAARAQGFKGSGFMVSRFQSFKVSKVIRCRGRGVLCFAIVRLEFGLWASGSRTLILQSMGGSLKKLQAFCRGREPRKVSRKKSACGAIVVLLLLASLASGAFAAESAGKGYPPTIVFMTDFGVVDDSVALCRGVMYSIMPSVRIVDLTHQVTPFSILDGARFLNGASPYFPAGTVFVVVIDPTVGSTRKAIIAKSKRGQYFVLPDNGLLTLVEQRDGIESVHEITNTEWMIGAKLSSTFHGRDIFSPAGAHVARGDDWTKAGPEVSMKDLVRLDLKAAKLDDRGLTAEVIATDGPFGNLVTNIDAEDFFKLGYKHGQDVPVMIGDKEMKLKFVHTFSDVGLNQPLLYIDSRGHLALAVNQNSFAAVYGVKPPASLFVARAK